MNITPSAIRTIRLTNNTDTQSSPTAFNTALPFDPVAALAAAAPVPIPAPVETNYVEEVVTDMNENVSYVEEVEQEQEYKTAVILTATSLVELINEEIDLITNAFFNLTEKIEPILIEDTQPSVLSDLTTYSTASHVASLQSVAVRLSAIRRRINSVKNRSAL